MVRGLVGPCGGTGRRARLKIEFRKECWFDSGQGHHLRCFAASAGKSTSTYSDEAAEAAGHSFSYARRCRTSLRRSLTALLISTRFLCPITKPLRRSSVGVQRWNRESAAVYEGRAESCPSGFFIQVAERPYWHWQSLGRPGSWKADDASTKAAIQSTHH